MIRKNEQKRYVHTIELVGGYVTVRADSLRWTVMVNVEGNSGHKPQTFVLERNPALLIELSDALRQVSMSMEEWDESTSSHA